MNCEKNPLDKEEHPFHLGDPPHGSQNYNVKTLEPEQQEALNKIKLTLRQDNEVYFNNHPEIRGLVSIIMRHLLEKEATTSQEIQSLLHQFFSRPRVNIAAELLEYFLEKNFKGPIVESLRKEISESDHKSEE